MSLFFNTKEPEAIYFNNITLSKVYFNQTLVWETILSTYTITYEDSTGEIFSQNYDDATVLNTAIKNLNDSGIKTITIEEVVYGD